VDCHTGPQITEVRPYFEALEKLLDLSDAPQAAGIALRQQAHLQLILQPGHSPVGNTGVLLTTAQFLKHAETKNFAIVDAAMNDLLRPTFYDGWPGVLRVRVRRESESTYDIVGAVYESGDWLPRQHELALVQADVLAIESAGAYGMIMASNYDPRVGPAEVMVDGGPWRIAKQFPTCCGVSPCCLSRWPRTTLQTLGQVVAVAGPAWGQQHAAGPAGVLALAHRDGVKTVLHYVGDDRWFFAALDRIFHIDPVASSARGFRAVTRNILA